MDSIPQQLLVQVILILLNALFAATEIAVLSLNGTKLKKLKEKGDKTADKLLKLVDRHHACWFPGQCLRGRGIL